MFFSGTAGRRPRKTNHGVKDFQALLHAIKCVKIHTKSVNSAAKAFNLNRISLGRYLVKFDAEVPDITKVSDDKLLEIVRRIGSYANTAQAHTVCGILMISVHFSIFFCNF